MKILTLSDKNKWLGDFEKIRERILSGNDRLKCNYDGKNLNIDSQEEATVILDDDDSIIAFSFLQHREFWGNISRALSRYYIVPKYRSGFFRSGQKITKIMLDVQVSTAKKMGKDFVFISREYPSNKWQKNFVLCNPGWCAEDDYLYQVCNGNVLACWQHCVWLKLSESSGCFSLPKRTIISTLDSFSKS